MNQYLQRVRWATVVIVAIGLAGCSSGDSLPDRVDAGGTVTYNGEPVAGAQVVFRVQGGKAATAVTGEDGRFILSTFGQQDGAIPGEHTATVVKTAKVEVDDPSSDPSNADTMEEAMNASAKAAAEGDAPTAKSLIPARYGNPETSELRFTVSATGSNDFSIKLTD